MDRETNILKWYSFEEGASVLEIYKETSILDKLEKKIKICKTTIQDMQIEGKFDYITLIGTYEYAPTVIEGEKPYSSFLKVLKKHLNPNGKILLAVNNRLGIKYFVGNKSEHYTKIFEGIESEIREGMPNLLLKKELEKFIKEAEFENYKFYYPLSDYINTNTIFTDEFIPKSNYSKSIYPVNYDDGSIIIYNEINTMKQICDNGNFENFTNSYLVEIANNKIENDIKFVNYNIFRKDKYRLVLIMGKDTVEKYAETNEAKEHIKNINSHIEKLKSLGFKIVEKVENEKVISRIVKSEELDKKIVTELKEGKIRRSI